MIIFPNINPVAFSLGVAEVRWYSLAYIAGMCWAWFCLARVSKRDGVINKKCYEDLIFFTMLASIIGGRLGYVIFYNFGHYAGNVGDIIKLWHGGMSFHGGLAGAIAAVYLVTKCHNKPFFYVSDVLALITPVGIFFGRIANFINGELYGRVTEVPWGVVFPSAGPEPRHPSQIYEAFFEGPFLLWLSWVVTKILKRQGMFMHGMTSFLFGMFYSVIRFFVEYFREPDIQIGYVLGSFTQGQLFSILTLLCSFIWLQFACKDYYKNLSIY